MIPGATIDSIIAQSVELAGEQGEGSGMTQGEIADAIISALSGQLGVLIGSTAPDRAAYVRRHMAVANRIVAVAGRFYPRPERAR
ncbi:hypothetical protein ATO13_08661 [Stappia sp. 22II-S9-Z10]|nr:hypothetical protein ATO13_08661 [Stappia sp. 22II-S9-Z10]